jgi:hypothetical protein
MGWKKGAPPNSSKNLQNNQRNKFIGHIYQRSKIKWIEAPKTPEFNPGKRDLLFSTPVDILPRKRFRQSSLFEYLKKSKNDNSG